MIQALILLKILSEMMTFFLSVFVFGRHNYLVVMAIVMMLVFECLVCCVACSPWDHHSESSLQSVEVYSWVQR